MNKIINKIFPILTLAFVLTMTACLNDSDYSNNLIGTKNTANQNFVEVHLTSADTTNAVSRAYDGFNRDTTINFIPVNLTSGPATSDVTVTFELLNATNAAMAKLIAAGNAIPDPTKFIVLNTGNSVTIPAGSSTGYIKVKFNPSNFGGFYSFGVKLTAVSDPKYTLSNLVTGFVKFGIKNQYDGDYTLTGTLVDAANAGIVGAYPNEVYLETLDATSVVMYDVTAGNFYHLIKSGGALSMYGTFAPIFHFDGSGNVTSVTNYYGQPASSTRSGELDPSGINKYDAATHKLSVSYWMNQPSVIAGHRTHYVEVFTYIGKRP
ncbi:MAG: DUF1735 domain-containing protein [Paludibacter sp.]